MKIKGITANQLYAAMRDTGSGLYDDNLKFRREPEQKGSFIHFTLGVDDTHNPGAARSSTGRRISAACWHAHRDVMRAIFKTAPDAILYTMLATYRGSDGFEHEFTATGSLNIGSRFAPMQRQHACACPSGAFFED